MAIKLGSIVTDKITGFKGVAIARTEFLHGCVRVSVLQSKVAEGKIPDEEFIDELRLKENDPKTTKPKNAILGTTVTDSISGFKGVAVAYTEYLNSSPRVSVQPKELFEGKPVEAYAFDEAQLKEYEAPKVGSKPRPGGPGKMAGQHRMATR